MKPIDNQAFFDTNSKYPTFNPYKWELETNLKHERLPHGSKNTDREHQALTLMGNPHLVGCTLLNAKIRKKHFNNLHRRLRRVFEKNLYPNKAEQKRRIKFGFRQFEYSETLDHEYASQLIRLLTVIHSVESLDENIALAKGKELKLQIEEYVGMMLGAACMGAIEVEVTSIKQMQRIRDFDDEQAKKYSIDEDGVITYDDGNDGVNRKVYFKLNTCKKLSTHLDDSEINGESGQFLIHFHGILKVNKPEDFDALEQLFLENPNWNRAPKQVEFKIFSKSWGDKYKPMESSVRDIARYITKGGAKLINKNSYLQYNLQFPDGISMSYDEFLTLSDRNNNEKRQAHIDKGEILDLPILSHHEINSLALVIDGMMNWNRSGTGYIVSVGKWSK